ncbi:unnamed protein product [Nezara viridula]|uniref:Uncharacterized protein n=1 Tax=Nezara viridula TaxID=85310 RepID=A0A9P0H4T6_NEZVI|nr:unnamed protein product [Nezara viridula]
MRLTPRPPPKLDRAALIDSFGLRDAWNKLNMTDEKFDKLATSTIDYSFFDKDFNDDLHKYFKKELNKTYTPPTHHWPFWKYLQSKKNLKRRQTKKEYAI